MDDNEPNEMLGCIGLLLFIAIALSLCILIKWLWGILRS